MNGLAWFAVGFVGGIFAAAAPVLYYLYGFRNDWDRAWGYR